MDLQLPIEDVLRPREACAPTRAREIGRSRQGRELLAYRFGSGPRSVSLIAGCHADEPVGPAMLENLVRYLAQLPQEAPELRAASWFVVPHTNPDGAARNAPWIEVTQPTLDCHGQADRGYDLMAYLGNTVRELPGDDVEFGFPRQLEDREARPENRAVADFLRPGAPFCLHGSFHGMGLAQGPWFLLEQAWIDRTSDLREALRRRVAQMGYEVFDIDRKGEKGFFRIDEGFTTRPDSRHMAAFFQQQGDPDTAAKFRPSSMELVRSLGGDPLTLVSEMPLFLLPRLTPRASQEGEWDTEAPVPADRDRRRELVAWIRNRLLAGEEERVRKVASQFGIGPMPIRDQMRLQLAFLNEGLKAAA